MAKRLDLKDVNIYYGKFHAVADVGLSVPPRNVTAFIGPSGCGKSTVLRLAQPHARGDSRCARGGFGLLDGEDIYGSNVDPVGVRKTIGMVFQRPNPFPTMSIKDNVVAGLKLQGERNKKRLDEVAERSLRGANLWNEVKDRLDKPGGGLSGGQQQRLCIAAGHRGLARRPAHGRAVLGARPDLDSRDRGPDHGAEEGLHHRDRHAQHAAGCACE